MLVHRDRVDPATMQLFDNALAAQKEGWPYAALWFGMFAWHCVWGGLTKPASALRDFAHNMRLNGVQFTFDGKEGAENG